MNSDRGNLSSAPPPLDEGYWSALLNEGEYASSTNLTHETDLPTASIMDFEPGYQPDNALHPNAAHEDWHRIANIMEADQTVDLKIIGYNRGGLLVEWHSLRGFVPASQLSSFPSEAPPQVRREALAQQIGTCLTLRVIELNPEQNRLVLSERAAEVQAGQRAQILDHLTTGDVIEGVVTNITDFGVFVDLGGLEGLIHISELSWGRVGHPGDVVDRNEEVEVFVMDVNKDAGRVALSIKRLSPDPWQVVDKIYQIGQTISGTITNVVDFGAFARIEKGLEGLIHVSELAEGHFLHPRNVVSEGQEVRARILSIDKHARRLGLSLRAVVQDNIE